MQGLKLKEVWITTTVSGMVNYINQREVIEMERTAPDFLSNHLSVFDLEKCFIPLFGRLRL